MNALARKKSHVEELWDAVREARDSMTTLAVALDRVDRDQLKAQVAASTDSPTDARNIGSAGLLRIVLQRTIEGEPLDEECEKLIAVLSKATGGQDLHLNPQPVRKSNALPEEGYYRFEGNFVKVQTSQSSGKPYAKMWLGDPETKQGRWEYQSGLYFKLRGAEPLSAQDAKVFGDLYDHCVFCGLELSDERSIAAGYGPTCAENRGLPWG